MDNTPISVSKNEHKFRDAFIILFVLFFPTLLTWAYFVMGERLAPGFSKGVFSVGKTLQFVFPFLITAFVLKERWLIRRFNTRGLLFGGAFGLVVALTIFFAGKACVSSGDPAFLQLKEELLQRLEQFGMASKGAFLFVSFFYSVIHSGLEEYYWRWFAFGRLAKKRSFIPAALIANIAFTFHHIVVLGVYFGFQNPLTWLCSFGVFFGGMVWQTIYRRTDSIYGAWLSHGLIDAGIFAVGFLLLP